MCRRKNRLRGDEFHGGSARVRRRPKTASRFGGGWRQSLSTAIKCDQGRNYLTRFIENVSQAGIGLRPMISLFDHLELVFAGRRVKPLLCESFERQEVITRLEQAGIEAEIELVF